MKAYSKICDLKLGKHVSINFVLVGYDKILEYMKFMLLYKEIICMKNMRRT